MPPPLPTPLPQPQFLEALQPGQLKQLLPSHSPADQIASLAVFQGTWLWARICGKTHNPSTTKAVVGTCQDLNNFQKAKQTFFTWMGLQPHVVPVDLGIKNTVLHEWDTVREK